MRVMHLITGLAPDGAQHMLLKLLSATSRCRVEPHVVSLTDRGEIGARIAEQGIPVEAMNLRAGASAALAVPRLSRLIRAIAPDLVQTWMYHADLLGRLACGPSEQTPLIWNIRHSELNPRGTKLGTRLVARASARLSHRGVGAIVCVSERSRRIHAALGYRRDIMTVIPNGFDIGRFRPDPGARIAVREALGVPDSSPLIGVIARYHPQKDHAGFFRAAAELRQRHPACHLLLAGRDLDHDNAELDRLIVRHGLVGRIHLLGQRSDTPRLFAALDLLVSPSAYGEGFPNVIGEAMACAVPCVVTDVGDSAQIVGDTGRAVPARDPDAMAAAIAELLGLPRQRLESLGAAARERIGTHYGLSAIATRYTTLYESTLGKR